MDNASSQISRELAERLRGFRRQLEDACVRYGGKPLLVSMRDGKKHPQKMTFNELMAPLWRRANINGGQVTVYGDGYSITTKPEDESTQHSGGESMVRAFKRLATAIGAALPHDGRHLTPDARWIAIMVGHLKATRFRVDMNGYIGIMYPFFASIRVIDKLITEAGEVDAVGSAEMQPTGLDQIPERVQKAVDQYEQACEGIEKDRPTDREAYDCLELAYQNNRTPSPLPLYSTWTSYLRIWRQATGQQKRAPRAGREHGRSIAGSDQI